jgi:hypothetical protein
LKNGVSPKNMLVDVDVSAMRENNTYANGWNPA